jgi:predicted  nucleic acid-binding Zn-ribbon protein
LKEDVRKLTMDKNLLEETVLAGSETIEALKKEKNDQEFQGTQLESRFEESQSKITQARSDLDRSEKNCRELESLASEKNLELEQCMHS